MASFWTKYKTSPAAPAEAPISETSDSRSKRKGGKNTVGDGVDGCNRNTKKTKPLDLDIPVELREQVLEILRAEACSTKASVLELLESGWKVSDHDMWSQVDVSKRKPIVDWFASLSG